MGKKERAAARSRGKKKGGAKKKKQSNNASSSMSLNSSDPSTLIKGEVPDFSRNSRSISNSTSQKYCTVYVAYKLSTKRFMEYMRDNVPDEISNLKTVNYLLLAVDWMKNNNHIMDPTILKDLKRCIRGRNRVAESVFGGGDDGHRHFLCLLVYCYSILRTLPAGEIVDEGGEDSNRFAAFDMELEEEEEDDEDTDMFPVSVPRPELIDDALTVKDLLESDDRNDAILFMLTLDELMGLVSVQYRVLVQNMSSGNRRGISDTAMVENLLDATIAANFALQSVQQLEMDLHAQHNHLNTPCRLLAALALPELTVEVDSIVRQHGSKSCERSDIIAFLGDSMQCTFHNPSDSWSRADSIVSDFASQYEVNTQGSWELEQLFKGLDYTARLEITTKIDINIEQLRRSVEQKTGKPHKSHSWLARMDFISGERAIHHTLRMLQLFGGVIDSSSSDKKLIMDPTRKGMFGNPNWKPGSSNKIRDLDEVLMSTLLPSWTNMCRHGIVGKVKLPRDSELCPFFMQLKSYVDNPRQAVSWSLAFGVHTALTSILEANRALPEIIDISKLVFNNYFDQVRNSVKIALKEESSNMKNSPVWKHNVPTILFLEIFGLPVFEDLALWNPFCGGTNLNVLNFLGNIDGGCAIIDCQAQLRIVMYLYHGLLINGIIENEEIPFLKSLYDGFKECKALWQGGSLPKKGELTKKFWISFGMGLSESKQMSDEAMQLARGKRPSSGNLFAQGGKMCRGRKMQPIDPAEMLTSFRRICERDFHDVVDKYHTLDQKRRMKGTEQYAAAVRTNDTLDHLEDEIQLHSLNIPAAAYYLEQFVCSLTRVLGWEQLLTPFMLEHKSDMRQGVAILFAQHILGVLDFHDHPLTHEFQNIPGLVKASPAPNIIAGATGFFVNFFNRVPPQNLIWFQAIESGDDTKVVTSHS